MTRRMTMEGGFLAGHVACCVDILVATQRDVALVGLRWDCGCIADLLASFNLACAFAARAIFAIYHELKAVLQLTRGSYMQCIIWWEINILRELLPWPCNRPSRFGATHEDAYARKSSSWTWAQVLCHLSRPFTVLPRPDPSSIIQAIRWFGRWRTGLEAQRRPRVRHGQGRACAPESQTQSRSLPRHISPVPFGDRACSVLAR